MDEMEDIKENQLIRENVENIKLVKFIGEVMESDEICKVIADKKWREKIQFHLMDDYGLEVDEFINNYKYTGGDRGRHLNYWNMTRNNEKLQPHKEYCICDHYIQENCYVVDRRDKNKIVVIGNCCIKRFLKKENQGRTCERCEKPHRSRKDNFCKECRIQNKEDEKLKKMEKEIEQQKEREEKALEEQKKWEEKRLIKRMEWEKKCKEKREQKEREREQKEIEREQKRKEKERVWSYEEIQEILLKIYEKRCCCKDDDKYEDEEKINDDFKICSTHECEKLIKKCFKYCYTCNLKYKNK